VAVIRAKVQGTRRDLEKAESSVFGGAGSGTGWPGTMGMGLYLRGDDGGGRGTRAVDARRDAVTTCRSKDTRRIGKASAARSV